MVLFLLGLVLFLGAHVLPSLIRLKAAVTGRAGEGAFKGVVAVLSAIGLLLIVLGYGDAKAVAGVLYVPPVWLRHVALLLMLFSFILLAATYARGKIALKARHPMLAAVKIWALAHLLANGDVADVLLFGSFLAWAVYARIAAKRREAAGRVTVTGGPVRNDIIAVVAGTVVYLVFVLWAHQLLFGVSPL